MSKSRRDCGLQITAITEKAAESESTEINQSNLITVRRKIHSEGIQMNVSQCFYIHVTNKMSLKVIFALLSLYLHT